MNKLVKSVKQADIYREYAQSLNGILDLTGRELEVLVKLIEFDLARTSAPDELKNVLSTENRKKIMKECNITADNLSRYVTNIKSKGLVIHGKVDGEWIVNPILMPEIIKDRIQITIILKINDK